MRQGDETSAETRQRPVKKPSTGRLPASVTQSPRRHYYVENVVGDDFTFYLSVEGNEHLLPNERRGGEGLKKTFSNAKQLYVVKISPLLTRADLKNDGTLLLKYLKGSVAGPPRSRSRSDWSRLRQEFSHALRTRIERIVIDDKKGKRRSDALLESVLARFNQLMKTRDMAVLLKDDKDYLSKREEAVIRNLSNRGQKIYRNRKTLNKHFQAALKPFPQQLRGRSVICRSYRDALLSVSFRAKRESSYEPDTRVSDEYPLSIRNYCDQLYKAVFDSGDVSTKRGLLVITGATNSAKSDIATGLIHRYLEEERRKDLKRRPHLVTFEDPIEKFYERAGVGKAPDVSVEMPSQREGIDYTPREQGNVNEDNKDFESLKEGLIDALRQTPFVLFVGETRNKEDWRHLIDFAGTGHLIVTTAHAGSLTEAMHKIFEALKVKTPAERSEIANRLLGIVHIKCDAATNILVPAAWRPTATAKHALTAEGLSSLLPHKPKRVDAETGCLGRTWFAEQLTTGKWPGLIREAIKWDLEGV